MAKATRRARADAGTCSLRVLPTDDLPGVQALKFEDASQAYSHYNDTFSIATLFRSASSISFRGKAHQALDGAVGLLEPDGIFRHLQIRPLSMSGSCTSRPPSWTRPLRH